MKNLKDLTLSKQYELSRYEKCFEPLKNYNRNSFDNHCMKSVSKKS